MNLLMFLLEFVDNTQNTDATVPKISIDLRFFSIIIILLIVFAISTLVLTVKEEKRKKAEKEKNK